MLDAVLASEVGAQHALEDLRKELDILEMYPWQFRNNEETS